MDIVSDEGHEINQRMIYVDVCEYCMEGVRWISGLRKHLREWFEDIRPSGFSIMERTTRKWGLLKLIC